MNQCERIIRHLHDFGTISSMEAMTEYGIYRLASRICDIRKRGIKIKSTTMHATNRYGEPTHFSVYSLEK